MDKIAAVNRMQAYIATHLGEEITLETLGNAAGYSKFHAARMFRELTGQTPFSYIRALRLTHAAQALRDSGGQVIDAALARGFDSHDGFTRAFLRQFGITPQKYRGETPPVRYFVPYPVTHPHILDAKEQAPMTTEKVSRTVTVTPVERPARKLVFLRNTAATDYFSACEEVGCEWEGLYNSIPEKFDTAAGGLLPKSLIKPGTSGHAFFVEVPLSYNKPIPEGYEIAELPPCAMLYFNGAPYENEDDFRVAIGIVDDAIERYPFERFGWKKSDIAPVLGMGASAAGGARKAVPVKRNKKAQ